MPIFTEEDSNKITETYEHTKLSMKECEFDYFSSLAVNYYVEVIMKYKKYLLEQLNNQAKHSSAKHIVRVPIEIVETTNPYFKKPSIGRVFSSLSGLHSRCMYDIYRNSDFRSHIAYMISDSNKFFVTLDFKLEDNGEEMRHTCTVWLNYRVEGSVPENKQIAFQKQHEKVVDIIN